MDFNGFSAVTKNETEKRDIEFAIRALFKTHEGKLFFKYLLKEFKVGDLPPIGMEGPLLHDYLGFCRAGYSLFEILTKISPVETSLLMADIVKENTDV